MYIEYPFINCCDALFKFMYENYYEPYVGLANFQGEDVEFFGGIPSCRIGSIIIVSPVYPRTIFIVDEVISSSTFIDGEFTVSIIRNYAEIDQMPCVTLPGYVREELILTARGDY